MRAIVQILICCTVFGQLYAQQKVSDKYLSGEENPKWVFFEESEHVPVSELMKDKTLLKLGAKDELKPISKNIDKTGMRHYRYQQTHNGIPVEWAVCLIHEKNARVTHANNSLIPELNLSTTPVINEADALQTALEYTNAVLYAWEDETHERTLGQAVRNPNATFHPSGQLVIIDPQLTQQAANCHLAYKFDIYAVQPLSRQTVYIDAHSGEVLKTIEKIHSCTDVPAIGPTNYSGIVDFTACYADGEYTLKNTIGGSMQVFDAGGDISLSEIPCQDPDGHFDMDAAATEVHWATEKTYEYFLDTHGRNSIDNNGAPLFSWVHYGSQTNNAYWTGTWMLYGDGDGIKFSPLTSPDIVAHEIIHGLTDHTANLIYEGESGAINESFSDIFGEAIERYSRGSNDWIVGADFTLAPKSGLRNMANPNDPTMTIRQPDTYLGDYYQRTGFADYGGVHTNSGVQNHWFYFLSEGGMGTNDNDHTYDIAGIGMEKAIAIAYHSLTTDLLPNASFEDVRISTVQAAEYLYGADEAQQVDAAWCAVGVGPGCVRINCRTIDSLAIVALYHSTDGANWEDTLDLTQPMHTWHGVTVNEEGCVIELSLSSNELSGSIPPEIGNFTQIEKMYLGSNDLTDSIPSEIGNLTTLKDLRLHNSHLTGSIPSEIGNLKLLEILYLDENHLSGSIPPEIGNLNLLERLYLYENDLSGSIPPEIGNLSELEILYLYENDLTGSIPSEIGNLNNLHELELDSNWLSGNIPPEIGEMDELEQLGLSINQLTGSIPAEIGNLDNLEILDLSHNQLSGSIPPEMRAMDDLEELDLSFNQLDGCFDNDLAFLCSVEDVNITGNNFTSTWGNFCNLAIGACSEAGQCFDISGDSLALVAVFNATNGLEWNNPWDLEKPVSEWHGVYVIWNCVVGLNLSHNQLEGNIPPEIGNLNNLEELNLDANHLSGSIPPEIGNLSQLKRLILSTNQFDSIPPEIGNLNNLEKLYLANANLSGSIPPEIGSLSRLKGIYLSRNNLSGSIPPEIGSLSQLKRLDFNDNDLSGSIPPEIGNLSQLEEMELIANNLSGNIPPEIGDLSKLVRLDLVRNQLNGNIPLEIGNLSNLKSLQLYGNELSGNIPIEIGNLSQLEYLNLGDDSIFGINQLSGSIPLEIGNLTNLTSLSLSNNSLSGGIPVEIGNLSELQTLKLFGNQLDGSIPSEIGNLSQLYRLDLSYNQLNGNIPVELGNLLELSSIDLSYNQLSGNIPTELTNIVKLNSLYLSDNELSGNIPLQVRNWVELLRLNLSNNRLSGNIPPETGNMLELEELYVSHNQLSGNIPREFGNLQYLEELDLSYNQLSGNIPGEFGNLESLSEINLSYNGLSGCFDANLSILCNIDSVNIDNGNSFDSTLDAFCTNNTGICPVIITLVLPGDFNNDGIVDKTDLIYWGLAEGYIGTIRPNATTDWTLQESPEWDACIGGVNCKHIDADGNGIIDEADLAVLKENYGKSYEDFSYSYSASPALYTLQKVAVDTVGGMKQTTYNLYLQANAPINTHGISVSVEFKDNPTISEITIDTTGSALQPTHCHIEPYDYSERSIAFSLTRTDKSNQLIDGYVARLFVIDKDLQIVDPTDVTTNSGKMMSATGVVTSVTGSTLQGSLEGANPTLPVFEVFNDAYCEAGGTADVYVSEGTPPYTYMWSTGATSSRINDLDIGTYTVTVSDATGLTNIVDFDINWAFTPTTVSADDGQICFDFEDAPLIDTVEVSLDNGLTYLPLITDNTCYPVSEGAYSVWIRLDSATCATHLADLDVVVSDIVSTYDNDLDIQLIDALGHTPQLLCNLTKPGGLNVNLYNTQGQQLRAIYEAETASGLRQIVINKDNLPRGIYFIHVSFISREGIIANKSLKILI